MFLTKGPGHVLPHLGSSVLRRPPSQNQVSQPGRGKNRRGFEYDLRPAQKYSLKSKMTGRELIRGMLDAGEASHWTRSAALPYVVDLEMSTVYVVGNGGCEDF